MAHKGDWRRKYNMACFCVIHLCYYVNCEGKDRSTSLISWCFFYGIMAKDFSRAFYHSALWQKVRADYANSKLYLCERCGGRGEIVHHKIHLTPTNINTKLATDYSNLELLCRYCHKQIHGAGLSTVKDVFFTPDGDVISPPAEKRG